MTGRFEKSNISRSLPVRLWVSLALGLCFIESGCSDFNVKHVKIGQAEALATRADIRVIMERSDPSLTTGEKHPTIVCAEPSPDVALALSRALTAEAHAKTPAGVAAGASGGYRTNEAALALAGRTSAVVALRDGLFRACEGYANGIIGRDSYALILSQYGDLLVTLILGDSAATNVGGVSTVTTEKIALPADRSAASDKSAGTDTASAPAKGAKAAATPAAPAAPASPAATPPAATTSAAVYHPGIGVGPSDLTWLAKSPVSANESPAPTGKTGQAAVKKETIPVSKENTTPPTNTTTIVDTKTTSPAEAIAKAYFAGEQARLVKAMFVVCTAEAERRRAQGVAFPQPVPGTGDYFDRMCTTNLQILSVLPDLVKAQKQ